MSAKKQGYSHRSVQGVNFFRHFSRERLRPYGEIREATPDRIMLEKATPTNCEYVVRPAVALSEMAATISSNATLLKDALRKMHKTKIVRQVEKMDQVVKMFNTRSELPVTRTDVHQLLKYAIADDDEETDDTFDKMEHLGMLLYVIGSHQKQLRSLVRNPVEYSGKCRELPATHEFKANPTSKTLKEWWAFETVTAQSKPRQSTKLFT